MKNYGRSLFVFLFALIFLVGCGSTHYNTRGLNQKCAKPEDAQQIESSSIAADDQEIIERLDKTNNLLSRLFEKEKSGEAIIAKRDDFFRSRSKKIIKSNIESSDLEKRVSRIEKRIVVLEQGKDRIARAEEIIETNHPGSDTRAIYFKPAESALLPKAKKAVNTLINDWFAGSVDILAIRSYASMSNPKDPNMSNIDYAELRLQETKQYLKEAGVQFDGIIMEAVGATSRFYKNQNCTFTVKNIKNEEEIKIKKEARKKFKLL